MSVTQGFVARQKWYGHGFQNISISLCPIDTIFGLCFENTCGNEMTRAFSDILTENDFFSPLEPLQKDLMVKKKYFESKYQKKLVSFHCHMCFQNTVQKLYQSDKN